MKHRDEFLGALIAIPVSVLLYLLVVGALLLPGAAPLVPPNPYAACIALGPASGIRCRP